MLLVFEKGKIASYIFPEREDEAAGTVSSVDITNVSIEHQKCKVNKQTCEKTRKTSNAKV